MPRTARRLAALLFAGATLVSLAACAPGTNEPTPSPSPVETDAPIFASDEEALAAAVAAYEAYRQTSSEITSVPSTDIEKIREVVKSPYADQLVREFEALRESQVTSVGESRAYGHRLAGRSETNGVAEVSAYVCRDTSQVRLVNASGEDVSPPDRSLTSAVLAQFESSAADPGTLIVAELERWNDSAFCE